MNTEEFSDILFMLPILFFGVIGVAFMFYNVMKD